MTKTNAKGQLKPLKARLTLKQSSRRESRLLTRTTKRGGLNLFLALGGLVK